MMETQKKLQKLKAKNKLVMLTAYDYPTAKILDSAGIDIILVGDSLAMVVLGNKDTKSVTMQEMLHHVKAVVRGAKNCLVVADMPANSYNNAEDAVYNAKLFVEAGADAVKIEGNKPDIIKSIQHQRIAVMGHIGLLPQTAERYVVQGRDESSKNRILNDALELDKLNLIAIVIESVPSELAKTITERTKTPTIGIGAGKHCKGQVLVLHDMLGLYDDMKPRFVKRYADLTNIIKDAILKYKNEVESGQFPEEKHSF